VINLLGEPWRVALENGLGARTVPIAESAVPMPLFGVGPLKVAYAGFPVGIEVEFIPAAMTIAVRNGASMLRVICNGDQPSPVGTYRRYIQTSIVIDRLDAWTPAATEKGRRTRNRRTRSDVLLRESTEKDAEQIWHLYRRTIQRHRGAVRYTFEYFRHLASCGLLVAESASRLIGFVAGGLAGRRAYYLHGAHDPEARASYPSDLLFLAMIESAQANGATSFDFLPSPAHQPQLHVYKRSWGGAECKVATHDVPIDTAGRLFAIAYAARSSLSDWRARAR